MAFDRNEYNKKYQTEKYYRFSVTLPIKYKSQVEQAAKAQGMSLSAFIVSCVASAIPKDQPRETETQYAQGFKRLQGIWDRQKEEARQRALLDDDEEELPF